MLQSIPITGAVLSLSDADSSAQPYLGSFAPRNDPQKSILRRAPSLNISDFRQMTSKIKVENSSALQHCMLWELGTNSVQLRERKNGFLVPKRHWMKHLDFLSF